MTKLIPLTKGRSAIVDDADFERLAQFKWCYRQPRPNYGYAITTISVDGRRKQVGMHRMIVNAPDDILVDHHDGNGINNVRSNIRIATSSQNNQNRGKKSSSRAPYKGITFYAGKWIARIRVDGRYNYLGGFTTPEDAARTYDAAAILHHGEFAKLNFPQEQSS